MACSLLSYLATPFHYYRQGHCTHQARCTRQAKCTHQARCTRQAKCNRRMPNRLFLLLSSSCFFTRFISVHRERLPSRFVVSPLHLCEVYDGRWIELPITTLRLSLNHERVATRTNILDNGEASHPLVGYRLAILQEGLLFVEKGEVYFRGRVGGDVDIQAE